MHVNAQLIESDINTLKTNIAQSQFTVNNSEAQLITCLLVHQSLIVHQLQITNNIFPVSGQT